MIKKKCCPLVKSKLWSIWCFLFFGGFFFFFFYCTEYVYQMVLWIISIAFTHRTIFSASSPWKDTFKFPPNYRSRDNGVGIFLFVLISLVLLGFVVLYSSLTYVWKHRLMKWKIKSKQETLVCFVIKKIRKMHYHFFQCSKSKETADINIYLISVPAV